MIGGWVGRNDAKKREDWDVGTHFQGIEKDKVLRPGNVNLPDIRININRNSGSLHAPRLTVASKLEQLWDYKSSVRWGGPSRGDTATPFCGRGADCLGSESTRKRPLTVICRGPQVVEGERASS